MHFKKNVSRAIVLLCVLASLLSLLPLGASGISYDGSGTSGNGTANQTGNGTYGIYQTDMEKELIGYRFTGIDASGKRAGDYSLDVILDDAHYVTATGNIENVLVMYPKYSKLEIHEVYKKFLDATNDGVDRDDYTVFSEVAGSGRKVFSSRLENPAVLASSLGCRDKMPKTAEALDVWQSKNENLDPIARRVGYSDGIESMGMNDKIIAEPLFVVVLEGADHALTLSELAVYVALTMLPKNINIMSDYGITGGGDKSNPTFIRKYTNYYFPNAFYTPDGQGLWGGATALGAIKGDASKFSNFPAISYGEILNKGYGAVIMYTAKEPADPGLPDYYINSIRFVDSSGREYNPEHLPMNKQLYVVVEYNCDTAIKNTKANLFIKRYTGNVYQGPSFPTSWEVVTSLSYRTGSDAQVAPWGAVRKSYSTSVTPAAITYGPDCDSYEVYALPMDPRTYEESGYIDARIYKAGKTSASSSDENNTNNNTMSIRYAYQSETKRDLETVEIVLRDDSGVEYSDYSAIPYGATVHVYHRYRSGSYSMIGSTKTYFDEPACIGYAAGNDGRYYRVKIDGKETFAVAGASSSSGAKEYYVGTIDAIHLVNQTRYGAVYLEHDYGKSMADEYNKNNNTASVTWHAKCNIRLYQIILHDGKGHNYAVKTYGKSYTAPTLPVGTKVYVSYVYKNTSGRELCVDGYLGNGSTIIDEANAIYVPANGTVEVNGGSFTVGSSAGSVAGHVYVNRANYGISSSANISTFETDINDNYMKAAYNVEEGYDVGITYIQYVYIDANGNNVTQSIANGSNAVATFPRGVQVYVWYTFRNHGNKTVNIDGYFQHNGTSDWTLMNGAGSYNANGVSLAPSASVTVCIGSFKAIDLGDKYYSGAVYRHGQTDTAGDSNPNNNTMSAKYRVYGDLWIAPYITDKDGNFIDEPDTLWQMEEYNICFIIFNNTPYPQYVDVYYTPDEGEEPQLVLKNFYLAECGSDGDYYDFIAATISAETEPRASSATTRLGTYMLTAEIYYTGTKSASGECDEDGNRYNPALEQLYSADNVEYLEYAVRAEVGIVDVIFNENEYGANQFREGTTVTVHYACTNPSTVDREVYLTFQGEYVRGEDGDPIKFVIPANSTESNPYVVYVTQFVVAYNNDYTAEGAGKVKATITRVGPDSSFNMEINSSNNKYNEAYVVYYEDVAVTDIFYVDAEGNFYGYGDNDPVTLMVGEDYWVCYTITNNSSKGCRIYAYDFEDVNYTHYKYKSIIAIDEFGNETEIMLREGTTIKWLILDAGASISIKARLLTADEQEIGKYDMVGSAYLNASKNASSERDGTNNVLHETLVLKHNVSINDVYYTSQGSSTRMPVDENGYALIPVNNKMVVHLVLQNHSGKPIDVNVYYHSTYIIKKVNGKNVITLQPYETIDVVLDETITFGNEASGYVRYSVYRNGYEPKTDAFETTFDDNEYRYLIKGILVPYLTPIKPNAPYREGTDVITSYYVYNPTNKAYNGVDRTLLVRFLVRCRRTGDIIHYEEKYTVLPSQCTTLDRAQVVYFKWHVPEEVLGDDDKFLIEANIVIEQFPGIGISPVSRTYDYINSDVQYTPDTQYEAKAPDGWVKPDQPATVVAATAKWAEWTYDNGKFEQHHYGVNSDALYWQAYITSISDKGNSFQGGAVTKSGYGIEMNILSTPSVGKLTGYELPSSDAYTDVQYIYAAFPEYGYSREDGCIASFEKTTSGRWKLYEFMDYGRVHWIPIWYPDGLYKPIVCGSDIWTPMGMIESKSSTSGVWIKGDMYDDWYIGHS